ncbi:MAG: M61 family metallopeptidase [Candidatus Cyclobacteriaceae bacterium M2_1C_046]
MLKYHITTENPLTHYFKIELEFKSSSNGDLELVLPLWRPGRYEAAEYAKNIRNLHISNSEGQELKYWKASKNVWFINASSGKIIVNYEYFAYQLDAGGSYLNDDLCLINFINCLMYPEGQQKEKCEVKLSLSNQFKIATTLPSNVNIFKADNYDELIDKPLLAARDLHNYNYACGESQFSIWVAGQPPIDMTELIPDFKAFSESQLKAFNSVPFDKYYFLIVSLPYRFYHGVEHGDNTLIVLGIDDKEYDRQKFIDDLLGVSSHELYHAWNIKKIRPKKLLPYNLKEPIFFDAGLIAEGFTTYYGDLFLARGGVWTYDRYLGELNAFFKKHYRNTGRFHSSIIDSSNNLWIDGYKPGSPYHKVSIYVKGAIIALMLDLKIRFASNHQKSLDNLMQILDEDFVENGYTIDDIIRLAEKLSGESLNEFSAKYIFGKDPVDEELVNLIEPFGLTFHKVESENILEKHYGIVTELKEDTLKVDNIFPGCPSEGKLSLGDEIFFINDKKPTEITDSEMASEDELKLDVKRVGKLKEVTLKKTKETWFFHYKLEKVKQPTEAQQKAVESWIS